MTKPILMIHRVHDEIFQHPLEKFILTFDDGYIDHYTSFSKFLEIPTQKIYFVTCKWACGRPDFLSVDQIKYMSSFENVIIGAHSFSHSDLKGMNIKEKIKYLEEDTIKTCDWFERNLGYIPTAFCYPYNNSVYGIYTNILKKYGFTDFYGSERIAVEHLSNPNWANTNCLW